MLPFEKNQMFKSCRLVENRTDVKTRRAPRHSVCPERENSIHHPQVRAVYMIRSVNERLSREIARQEVVVVCPRRKTCIRMHV